ncbi:hypothetical protein [Pseudobacteroides cellulosolvens]|nr:hypothetical protein [Pseudobacteroides cellulosolvens]
MKVKGCFIEISKFGFGKNNSSIISGKPLRNIRGASRIPNN